MRRTRGVAILIVSSLLGGCARTGHIRPEQLNGLFIGMPKSEAVQLLGTPDSVSATGTSEEMNYVLDRSLFRFKTVRVKVDQGKVTSFE